ncbi:hypothetical protein C1646_766477 [Rhizophagus diaphanus]|nr:hypothetical protein C1646_766477 [Rhizophagus diaphanus] [Rhizophagus sp. MUCL 43196]
MNSLIVLYRILRKFYKGLKRDFEINFLLIPLIFFPIISGIIMFYGRTVYHGLAFLGVHSFPIVGGIAYFYTQYFLCRDNTISCNANSTFYTIGVSFLISLSALFQLLHTIYVYFLWKKRIWPLVYEFKHSRHDEIKDMHAIYEVQFPLFHAQIMMIGLLLVAYLVGICGNFIQALLLYFDMESFCKKFKVLANADSTIQCFQYNLPLCAFLIYACLCWIVLALSTWNTIRCHKNFGKNMSDYITYEPTPPEFESGRKLVKRESSVPKHHSHIV